MDQCCKTDSTCIKELRHSNGSRDIKLRCRTCGREHYALGCVARKASSPQYDAEISETRCIMIRFNDGGPKTGKKADMNDGKNCVFENKFDENRNPTGGSVKGNGLDIRWQDGPLGRGDDRKEPNGAFVETVLEACAERLRIYQASKYSCRENAIALTHIETALLWMEKRTRDREHRDVEGTYAE